MGTLDWGWSLGGSSPSVGSQAASTSGMGILNSLLGGGTQSQQDDSMMSGPNPNAPGTNPNGPMGSTPKTSVNPQSQAQTMSGTGNPGNQYGNNPNGYDRWQGGAADPNGTQAPNGRQTGGRYVDPTYQTDATGRQLSPDEQNAWKAYDTARANASTREQQGYQAYKANQAAASGANGDKAVFDARSKTWSVYDPAAKKWNDGISQNDLLGQLSPTLRSQNPDWWWGQSAQADINQEQYQNTRYANQYEATQTGGRQQTRYSTYGL